MKLAIFAATLWVAGPGFAQNVATPSNVIWKLATGYSAESFHTQNINAFAAEVARASAPAARDSTERQRRNGGKTNATPPALERDVLQRIGERFSSEWVKAVGVGALEVFIPYFMTPNK